MSSEGKDRLWGQDAFTPGRHGQGDINHGIVGAGKAHVNRACSDRRVTIHLRPAKYLRRWGLAVALIERHFREHVECLVDTGATTSVFRGEIADELNLPLDDENVEWREFGLTRGSVRGHWCRHTLGLDVGPQLIPVPVWFPVVRERDAAPWRYRDGFLRENILGMNGVLCRRMLCLTPTTLYAFARSRSAS